MLKNCQQMQMASYQAKASASTTLGERYSKIKKNIEKSKKVKGGIPEDEEMMNAGDQQDESDNSSQ